ncbi:MAG: hypothetical protein INH41_18275 [Myxococcaceae bacterium]|jgi:DNA-directed RNA polymerase specialized sigma24 family protein|nr:hypothetical protein [Myxococcaceae bacterium]MCA3014334.1 hypothetical protein [Myxococcaceae bacterium]
MNDAWTLRISEHDHVVVLALLSRGVRLQDARDLAQDAWARLVEAERAGRLERIELPGLVIRQAMFLLAERHRVLRRRVDVDVEVEVAAELPASGEPESIVDARRRLALVSATLEQVPPRGRQVMESLLASSDGHAQQAARIGLSVQRFRQVLCEVRARLRAAMGEDGR